MSRVVEYIYETSQRHHGIAGRDKMEWRTNGNRVNMYIFQTIWHLSRCIQLNAVLMMICHDNVCCFYTDSFSGVSLYFCFRFSFFFINIYSIIIFVHIFSSFIHIFINKYVLYLSRSVFVMYNMFVCYVSAFEILSAVNMMFINEFMTCK